MNPTRSSSKADIEKLVRYFEKNIHQLKAQGFNEAQAPQSLIDPFFEALGWDVRKMKLVLPFKDQINATDRQIDEHVYRLYGITEEERRIIEGSAG